MAFHRVKQLTTNHEITLDDIQLAREQIGQDIHTFQTMMENAKNKQGKGGRQS